MPKTDSGSFGDRMKRYESVTNHLLTRRMPVIGRIDGKAFHTFTAGMGKPYDIRLQRAMWAGAKELCRQAQGAQIAYVQSDEISILLVDYKDIRSESWFDYQIQKLASVAASIVTGAFIEALRVELGNLKAIPAFDARFFSVPHEEVTNYFIWRQLDAVRNSVSGLAQAHFSHRQLHQKNSSEMQDMLFLEKSINWNDQPVPEKRGVCIYRKVYPLLDQPEVLRSSWEVDCEIPTFSQDRGYIEKYVRPAPDPAMERSSDSSSHREQGIRSGDC